MHDRIWGHLETLRTLYRLEEAIVQAADWLGRIALGGRTTFFVGCGGSQALAQHLAAEYVVRFREDRRALPALAVGDPSSLTAAANDLGWERALARPILALAQPGDGVVALSTSGRSPAVLEAARAGRQIGAGVLALTGQAPNELAELADVAVCVPSQVVAYVQECHLVIGHLWCEIVEHNVMKIGAAWRGGARHGEAR